MEAFSDAHSEHTDFFRKIESEWDGKKQTCTYTNTVYKEFKKFYTTKLKNLYTDTSLNGSRHSDNLAENVLHRVAALEANVADNADVLDELVVEQENATAFLSRTRQPPETFTMRRDDATATDTTLASTSTLRSALAEQAAQHAASQRAFEARIEALESGTQQTRQSERSGGKRNTE